MWIESTKPIRVQSKQGEVRLRPGYPVELSDEQGQKLLDQAGDKVRIVKAPRRDVIVELAVRPDGTPLSPIYWEDAKGCILGPAVPKLMIQTNGEFWLAVVYDGQNRWIRSDRLRNRRAFDTQTTVVETSELIPRSL